MSGPARSRVSRTVAAAGNYAAGDIVSNSATNGAGTTWDFEQMAVNGAGRPAMIYKADIACSEDSVTAAYRLHLFSAAITASELDDNAAKAFDNDDRANLVGVITFPAMADEGEYSRAQVDGLTFGYWCGQAGHTLYGVLEDLTGETNETAAMTVAITLWAI